MRYIIASIVELVGCLLLILAIIFMEIYKFLELVAGKINILAHKITKDEVKNAK